MKKIFSFIFALLLVIYTNAQRNELGISLGGANSIGDIGTGNYINPFPVKTSNYDNVKAPISLGLLYRFNFNPHMGIRANLAYAHVVATDKKSAEKYKIERSKSFSNSIFEGSLLFEYNFFNINDIQERSHSPYIFGGIGLAMYNKLAINYNDKNNTISYVNDGKESTLVLPIGIGYKYRFNYNWIISVETGFRYTNKDNLDYNNLSINNPEDLEDYQIQDIYRKSRFGNLSNNDWYVITGFTLTYSFGRPACYCN